MLRTVIFSKDRPAQLDLLLRSIQRFVSIPGWRPKVLLRATEDCYAAGYETVRADHPEAFYVEETILRYDVQALTLGTSAKYLQFLMDDDVFVRPFSLDDPEFAQYVSDPEIVGLVLRMSRSMDYCYTQNIVVTPPEFAEDGTWDWRGRFDDWGYPYSVDGSIWTMARVEQVLKRGNYESLNALEPALLQAMRSPRALCYDKTRLVGIPHNSVQDAFKQNRHEGGDNASLNERFLAGERIAIEPFVGMDPPSPHVDVDYQWETR